MTSGPKTRVTTNRAQTLPAHSTFLPKFHPTRAINLLMQWKAHGRGCVVSSYARWASLHQTSPPSKPPRHRAGRPSSDQVRALQQKRRDAIPLSETQLAVTFFDKPGGEPSRPAPCSPAFTTTRTDGRVLVDIRAVINADLLARIEQGGGRVVKSFPQSQSPRPRPFGFA
jgi:hypothetical protein